MFLSLCPHGRAFVEVTKGIFKSVCPASQSSVASTACEELPPDPAQTTTDGHAALEAGSGGRDRVRQFLLGSLMSLVSCGSARQRDGPGPVALG